MPLPRALPFRVRFDQFPGTKKSAVRQPDHFKWKFVNRERPVFFERGQFKDELGAVGRWFRGRGCGEGVEGVGGSGNGNGKIGEVIGKVGEGVEEVERDVDVSEMLERKKKQGVEEEEDYDESKYKRVVQPSGPGKPTNHKKVLHLKPSWLKEPKEVDQAYWEPFGDLTVPLEKITRIPNGEGEGQDAVKFERFEAPLFVFLAWNKRKLENPETYQSDTDLYLAQYSLKHLPKELRKDLPTPELLVAGQGVDSSSLWMGVPPTDTPLHRDPNANFFVQLAGRKKIRMLKPADGDVAYATIRNIVMEENEKPTSLTRTYAGGSFAKLGAKMRGDEMMSGLEKKLMDSLIWGEDLGVWSWKPDEKMGKQIKIGFDNFVIDVEAEDVGDIEAGTSINKDTGITAGTNTNENVSTNEDVSTSEEFRTSDNRGTVPFGYKRLPLFKGFEAILEPGDGCFIPKGWWHSLRGIPEEPLGINASVNWWFRGAPNKVIHRLREKREREAARKEQTDSTAEEGGLGNGDGLYEGAHSGGERKGFAPRRGYRGKERRHELKDVDMQMPERGRWRTIRQRDLNENFARRMLDVQTPQRGRWRGTGRPELNDDFASRMGMTGEHKVDRMDKAERKRESFVHFVRDERDDKRLEVKDRSMRGESDSIRKSSTDVEGGGS